MDGIRDAIAGEIRRIFVDRSGAGGPIALGGEGLFGPESVSRRVHGDVMTMLIGGTSALLLQMLHPGALAGVWDHSDFRRDMQGRLRRTAQFIALTTYGARTDAEAAIERVRRIHDRVRGQLPDGRPYAANDPELLNWVHLSEVVCFLKAYRMYREPWLSERDQDRYFAEMAEIARRLGATEVPVTRRAGENWLSRRRGSLRSDERTREIARMLLSQPARSVPMVPVQALTVQAAIDLLPPWARRMHRLNMPVTRRPLIRMGALGLTQTLRWAMAPRAAAS